MNDKCPNALSMLGDLELKNDDWVKAKETFRAASDATDGKDSYAILSLVCSQHSLFVYFFKKFQLFYSSLSIEWSISLIKTECFSRRFKFSCLYLIIIVKKVFVCVLSHCHYCCENNISVDMLFFREIGTTLRQFVMRKEIPSWKLPIWKKPKNCIREYGFYFHFSRFEEICCLFCIYSINIFQSRFVY